MASAIVSVLGIAALLFATSIVVRGMREERVPGTGERPAAGERLREATRRLSATLGAGFVGGLLVAGFGGRFFMRAVGATSNDAAQGRLTEAGEVVGKVTFGGTVFFLFLGAAVGVLGAAGFAAVRAWLPVRSVAAGLVAAGIGSGLLARPTELLAPDSVDFVILGPVWFAVAFALFIVLVLGATTAVLADRWVRVWPAPALSIRGALGLLPLVPILLLGPGAVIVPALVAARTVWPETTTPGQRAGPGLAAAAVLVAGGVVGWAWTLVTAVEILA